MEITNAVHITDDSLTCCVISQVWRYTSLFIMTKVGMITNFQFLTISGTMNVAPGLRDGDAIFPGLSRTSRTLSHVCGPGRAVSLILNEYLHKLLNNTNNTNNKSFNMINSSVLVTLRMRYSLKEFVWYL